MKIFRWLDKLQTGKKENIKRIFAKNIMCKYEWKRQDAFSYAALCHRRAAKPSRTIIRQDNTKQIEQIIKKYMPRITEPATPVIVRKERARLLLVITEINGQDGERKQLEELIFRRREREWKKTVRLQEEEVRLLRQELLHQKKTIETLEKKVIEPVVDTDKLYAEFKKRMGQQLHLERQRAGL